MTKQKPFHQKKQRKESSSSKPTKAFHAKKESHKVVHKKQKNDASSGQKRPSSIQGMKKLLVGKRNNQSNDEGKEKGEGKKRKFHQAEGNSTKKQKSNGEKKDSSKPLSGKHRKPYYQLVEKLKQVWNKIRDRSVSASARDALLSNLLQSIQNHIVDIALRHDASRIVQTLIQFGNDQQRQVILQELLQKFYEIAKAPYGHFTILKMVTYGNKPEFMKKISQGLKAHFVSLGTHVIGARTVETVLQLYPSMYTKHLKAEFYGKNFNLLVPEVPGNLQELMLQLPKKHYPILDHMKDLIAKFVQKGLFDFQYVHQFVWEYLQALLEWEQMIDGVIPIRDGMNPIDPENDRKKLLHYQQEVINSLLEMIPKLLTSKLGNKCICYLITITTAKDRKKIIKQFKGKVLSSLLDKYAFVSILKLLAVTDDTINIQKTLLEEIKTLQIKEQYTATGELMIATSQYPLLQIIQSESGHKLFLYLLSFPRGNSGMSSYLAVDYEYSLLCDLPSKTSKKEDGLRKKEYLVYFQESLHYILNRYVEECMRNKYAMKVLEAFYYQYYGTERGQSLIANIIRVFTHQETIVDLPDDLQDNEGKDIPDDDEEEEEEEEVGDEEEEDGEEEVMDDEFNEGEEEEGEEENEIEDEEQFQEQLKEAEADKALLLKGRKAGENAEDSDEESNSAMEVEVKDVSLPIEEDPTAHVLLKRLLRFEVQLQEKYSKNIGFMSEVVEKIQHFHTEQATHNPLRGLEMTEVSDMMERFVPVFWSKEEVEVTDALSGGLLSGLRDDSALLSHWLITNRCCYVLMELSSIPSVHEALLSLLQAQEGLEEQLQATEGGRLLWKLLQFQQGSKTKEKKEKGSQRKKKATK